jgi:AcrR family transcriptional regulator
VALFTDDRLEAGETIVPRDFVGESPLESIVLAARASVRRWGWDKVTMDDICAEAGVSRATLYRMFPGGRDVLFDAMREVRRREFFEKLRSKVEGADTFEEFMVRAITVASVELRDDTELATMIATTPGETLGHLTISDVPHIVSSATCRAIRESRGSRADARGHLATRHLRLSCTFEAFQLYGRGECSQVRAQLRSAIASNNLVKNETLDPGRKHEHH